MDIRHSLIIASVLILGACATQKSTSDDATRDYDLADVHAHCYGYIYGREGYPQDYAKAYEWCKRGADLGIPSSETLFAELYYEGHYVTKDNTIAAQWYLRAAKQEHVHAEFMVAWIEMQSKDPDLDKACFWLDMSSLQGYDKATTWLNTLNTDWKQTHPEATKAFCDRDFSHVEKY